MEVKAFVYREFKASNWKINWIFVEMEMFRSCDSSSSSFDSDISNDNDIIFVSCYPTPTRNAVRPQLTTTNVTLHFL